MTRNIANRVDKLENMKNEKDLRGVRQMSNDELIEIIRDGLEEGFSEGINQDLEPKIRAYEAQGKTFSDIKEEEPEWFDQILNRIIEQSKAAEEAEDE